MDEQGWQPPSNPTYTPVPDLREDEFMEFEADLGSKKTTLYPGSVIRLRCDYINFGGMKLTPDKPVWIKIKVVRRD